MSDKPPPNEDFLCDEKPKTKWFRDPKTGYWVQVQKPTCKFIETFSPNVGPGILRLR